MSPVDVIMWCLAILAVIIVGLVAWAILELVADAVKALPGERRPDQ